MRRFCLDKHTHTRSARASELSLVDVVLIRRAGRAESRPSEVEALHRASSINRARTEHTLLRLHRSQLLLALLIAVTGALILS